MQHMKFTVTLGESQSLIVEAKVLELEKRVLRRMKRQLEFTAKAFL